MAAGIVHASLVSKPVSLERLWPLKGDSPAEKVRITWGDTPEERKANWDKIMGAHKVKK